MAKGPYESCRPLEDQRIAQLLHQGAYEPVKYKKRKLGRENSESSYTCDASRKRRGNVVRDLRHNRERWNLRLIIGIWKGANSGGWSETYAHLPIREVGRPTTGQRHVPAYKRTSVLVMNVSGDRSDMEQRCSPMASTCFASGNVLVPTKSAGDITQRFLISFIRSHSAVNSFYAIRKSHKVLLPAISVPSLVIGR